MKISWRDSPAELERLKVVRSCIDLDVMRAQRVHPVTDESIARKKALNSELGKTVAQINALEQVVLEAKRARRWENGGQR
jgi:hypothetical protein